MESGRCPWRPWWPPVFEQLLRLLQPRVSVFAVGIPASASLQLSAITQELCCIQRSIKQSLHMITAYQEIQPLTSCFGPRRRYLCKSVTLTFHDKPSALSDTLIWKNIVAHDNGITRDSILQLRVSVLAVGITASVSLQLPAINQVRCWILWSEKLSLHMVSSKQKSVSFDLVFRSLPSVSLQVGHGVQTLLAAQFLQWLGTSSHGTFQTLKTDIVGVDLTKIYACYEFAIGSKFKWIDLEIVSVRSFRNLINFDTGNNLTWDQRIRMNFFNSSKILFTGENKNVRWELTRWEHLRDRSAAAGGRWPSVPHDGMLTHRPRESAPTPEAGTRTARAAHLVRERTSAKSPTRTQHTGQMDQ